MSPAADREAIRLIEDKTSLPVIPAAAESRIKCGINCEPRFDRLTVLSEVEGGSRKKDWIPPDRVRGRL